jgi:hypothetical protein
MQQHIAAYRKAAKNPKPLTAVTTNKVAAYTLVHHCPGKDDPQHPVWKSIGWWYQHLAQFTIDWELPNISKEEADKVFPLLKPLIDGKVPMEHFDKADMILVGDTESIIRKAKRYADLGVDQLICYVQWGYLEHQDILRTIDILGKEVIPELARYKPTLAAA